MPPRNRFGFFRDIANGRLEIHVNGPTNPGAESTLRLVNDDNAASAGTQLVIECGGSSASGDAAISLLEASGHELLIGVDTSASRFAITAGATLGAGDTDAIRITDAAPPVATYNATHPTGTFDYICDGCGAHDTDYFECCGKVEWHDDVEAIGLAIQNRGYNLQEHPGMQHLAKIGVLAMTQDEDGVPWTGINMAAAQWYTWSGMYQMHNRIKDVETRLAAAGV